MQHRADKGGRHTSGKPFVPSSLLKGYRGGCRSADAAMLRKAASTPFGPPKCAPVSVLSAVCLSFLPSDNLTLISPALLSWSHSFLSQFRWCLAQLSGCRRGPAPGPHAGAAKLLQSLCHQPPQWGCPHPPQSELLTTSGYRAVHQFRTGLFQRSGQPQACWVSQTRHGSPTQPNGCSGCSRGPC